MICEIWIHISVLMNPEKFLESMLKMLKSWSFVDNMQEEILGCEEKFKTKIFLHIFV